MLTVPLLCRQLDWRPEKKAENRMRHEKVVIIRNMFHPSDFEVQTRTVPVQWSHTWLNDGTNAFVYMLSALTGRPTGAEWISWGSASRVWEIRGC